MMIFARTAALIGDDALGRLSRSHVAVFGLGGVGSYAAEALARSGVGELTLVDSDVVDVTNINRQIIALRSTVGRPKTEVMRDRVLDINPACRVHIVTGLYLPDVRDRFFTADYDYIADAIDNVTAKTDLIVTAYEKNIPVISAMGTGNKLRPEELRVSDIYKTEVCPLCRVMRRELRKRNIPSLKVVYSREKPVTTGMTENGKTVPASIAFVPSVAGLLMAKEIINGLIGEEKK